MHIAAVTIAVNYSDFLAITLPINKKHFDEYIVITDKQDLQTQELCESLNVQFIATDIFYTDNANFNKGKAINLGLKNLKKVDWILQLDADLVLPNVTREILEKVELNEQYLYGIDRVDCLSKTKWTDYLNNNNSFYENMMYITLLPHFSFATRMMLLNSGGYIPLGFFQLFNINADTIQYLDTIYSENFPNADGYDIEFALRWRRSHRHLLPEIIGVHLTSNTSVGINWQGRKSKKYE